MTESIIDLINDRPVLTLFLVIASGLLIGNIRIGSFRLGSVVGVLIIGMMLGNIGFKGDAALQTLGIVLFLFSVGYEAGPRFIKAVKKDGRKYFTIAFIIAASALILCYVVSKYYLPEPGYSAGLLAGSITSKPTLAASLSTIESAKYIAPAGHNIESLQVNITSSYAITYIFGFLGLILIVRIVPLILRINLSSIAEKLDEEVNGILTNLAGKSPIGMKIGKEAFTKMSDMPFEEALDFLCGQLGTIASTEDAKEGIIAFLEKREPNFVGR